MKLLLIVILSAAIVTARAQIKVSDTSWAYFKSAQYRDTIFVYWPKRYEYNGQPIFSGIQLIPWHHKDSLWNMIGLVLQSDVEMIQIELAPYVRTRKFPWPRVY